MSDRQPEYGNQPELPPPPAVPVNAPLMLLALVGGAFAVRRLRHAHPR